MKTRSSVSLELVQAMYDYYIEGHSLFEVSEKFNYTEMAISHIFKRHGLKTRTPQETRAMKIRPETIAMYEDYKSGLSLQEVGEKYGVTLYCPWFRFKKLGLKMRPMRGAPDNGYDFADWQGNTLYPKRKKRVTT